MTLLSESPETLSPKPPTARIIKTSKAPTDFALLSAEIKEANLLEKTERFYMKKFVQITFLVVAAWVGTVFFAASPLVLVFAPIFGILAAQYGFLAHEAGHKQVFSSNKKNEWFALITADLFVGLSYGWWNKKKHNLHHANPNTVGKDPDIKLQALAFTKEDYDAKKGLEKILIKHQGKFFPFLLLFTGFHLLWESYKSLLEKNSNLEHRKLELFLLTFRLITPLVVLFLIMPPTIAIIFAVVQMMIFGLFMGGAFAPNHKGMPVIPKDAKVDFFRRQVLTSRDIRGGWLVDNLMGGLNYQVEHHLFPSMPRPHLKKAQDIVRRFCAEREVPYVETNLFESYGIVIKYLDEVGLKEADPFECPVINQFRRRD
jgi:fatty acid desaturase